MGAYEIWWSLAIMVATVELFFGALYFVAGGFALICGGIAARFGASVPTQFAVALAIFGIAFALLRWRDRRRAVAAGSAKR